jgi:hypothetical protein
MPLLASGQLGSLSTVQRFGYGIITPDSTKPSSVLNRSVEGVWHKSNTSDLPVNINPNCEGFSWPSANALWTYGIGQGAGAEGDSGGPVIDAIAPGSYAVAGITQGSLDLRDCTLTQYNPNPLRRQYLGLSNRVDQGSAEWGFISGLVPDVETLSPSGWAGTRAPLPAGADGTQGVTLSSVSCPSAGACTVAGSDDGGNTPLLETLSGGSWSPTDPPLPPDAFPYNQSAHLSEVSCADSSTCAAVGSYEDANTNAGLIETGSGGTWTATRAPVPPGTTGDPYTTLNAVTCLSDTSCIALGTYAPNAFYAMIDTLNGQGWTSVNAPLPPDASATDQFASLGSLSCPTPTSCVATGSYINASGETEGVIESYKNGSWTAAVMPLPADAATSGQFVYIDGLACPAAGSCVAAGTYTTNAEQGQGFLSRLSNGAWNAVEAALPADSSASNPDVRFGGFSDQGSTPAVACSAKGACVAVGTYYSNSNDFRPLIEQLAATTWTTVPAAFPPGYADGNGYLNSVVCPSPGTCIAGGSVTANGNSTALVDALGGGNWTAPPVTLPQDSTSPPNAFLWNTDCSPTGFCASAGGYYANDNTNQGLLVTSG